MFIKMELLYAHVYIYGCNYLNNLQQFTLFGVTEECEQYSFLPCLKYCKLQTEG